MDICVKKGFEGNMAVNTNNGINDPLFHRYKSQTYSEKKFNKLGIDMNSDLHKKLRKNFEDAQKAMLDEILVDDSPNVKKRNVLPDEDIGPDMDRTTQYDETFEQKRLKRKKLKKFYEPTFMHDLFTYLFVEKHRIAVSEIAEKGLLKPGGLRPKATERYDMCLDELMILQNNLRHTVSLPLSDFDNTVKAIGEEGYKALRILYNLSSIDIKEHPYAFAKAYLKINHDDKTKGIVNLCVEKACLHLGDKDKALHALANASPFIKKHPVYLLSKDMSHPHNIFLDDILSAVLSKKCHRLITVSDLKVFIPNGWKLDGEEFEEIKLPSFAVPAMENTISKISEEIAEMEKQRKIKMGMSEYVTRANKPLTGGIEENRGYLNQLRDLTMKFLQQGSNIHRKPSIISKTLMTFDPADLEKASNDTTEMLKHPVRKAYRSIEAFKWDLMKEIYPDNSPKYDPNKNTKFSNELSRLENQFSMWNKKCVSSLNEYEEGFYDRNKDKIQAEFTNLARFYNSIVKEMGDSYFDIDEPSKRPESYFNKNMCFLIGAINSLDKSVIIECSGDRIEALKKEIDHSKEMIKKYRKMIYESQRQQVE